MEIKQDQTWPLYEKLCRHFVGIYVYIGTPEGIDDAERVLSGFLLSVEDVWFWIGAGHAIQEVVESLKQGCILKKSCLVDLGTIPHPVIPELGPNPPSTLFEFAGAPKFYIDEDGIDLAAVEIHDLYRGMLKANGATPIEPPGVGWSEREAGAYFLIGAPEEFTRSSIEGTQETVEFSPVMWRLKRLPNEFTDGVLRLCFDVHGNEIFSAGRRQESMVGMSGGAIFGVRDDEDGKTKILCLRGPIQLAPKLEKGVWLSS